VRRALFAASVGAVVITSGPDDITLHVGKKNTAIPTVKPQDITEPNGADDAFFTGYSYGRLKDLTPEWCTKIGSTAASFAVETTGTQGHRFTTDKFYERLEHTYGIPDFNLSK
jgi:ribokinase